MTSESDRHRRREKYEDAMETYGSVVAPNDELVLDGELLNVELDC
jgi:hypothetical protein